MTRPPENEFDIAIIGAGIAGASAAANLPDTLKILLLEGESTPGYHSTGRSAAIFSAIYGNEPVRALSRASHAFLVTPPPGFSGAPLVAERGIMFIARADQQQAMDQMASQPDVAKLTWRLSAQETVELCPLLRPGYASEGLFERDALDLDVHALHEGFLRMARVNGCRLVTSARVIGLTAEADGWSIETTAGSFRAGIVVNAAGAWADHIADVAGVEKKQIQAMQRTMVLVDSGDDGSKIHWPMTVDIDEQFYFKPESSGILLSPADETPVPPGDVQPDELDMAIAIDRVETATTLSVRRIKNKWAGLRNFAPDRTPVVGFDANTPSFFWLVGQGGYGIQTAPALGQLAAALMTQGQVPAQLIDEGFDVQDLSPTRPALSIDQVIR